MNRPHYKPLERRLWEALVAANEEATAWWDEEIPTVYTVPRHQAEDAARRAADLTLDEVQRLVTS